jgi:hypothetical protein
MSFAPSSSDIIAIASGTTFVVASTAINQMNGDHTGVAAGVVALGLGYVVNGMGALMHGKPVAGLSTLGATVVGFSAIGCVAAAFTSAICAVL